MHKRLGSFLAHFDFPACFLVRRFFIFMFLVFTTMKRFVPFLLVTNLSLVPPVFIQTHVYVLGFLILVTKFSHPKYEVPQISHVPLSHNFFLRVPVEMIIEALEISQGVRFLHDMYFSRYG